MGMERRSPTGIARERETRTRRRYATITRERETRPSAAAPHQSHGCEPTHHHPRRTTETWSAGQFSRWGPPTGIARERETRTNDPTPRQSHRCERRITTRAEPRRHGALASSPGGGLRPASRVSAKPAPTTLRPDRAEARNPHQRPYTPPISPLRTTHHHPRRTTGTWSAGQFSRWGPPTGIARERETRPSDPTPRQSHRCERRITTRAEPRGNGAPVSDRHRA